MELINLYTNYKATGDWDKNDVSRQKSIIVLATALANERAKNKSNKGKIMAIPMEAEEIITPKSPHGV